jgi:hemerythrin-like domain-containing protein
LDHQRRPLSRRSLLTGIGSTLTALGIASTGQPAQAFSIGQPLPPAEDLMQEHGVLERILLIYDELSKQLAAGHDDKEGCLGTTTRLITTYVQGHHERVEELVIFPALTKAEVLPELVNTLVTQHQAGRDITDAITARLKATDGKRSNAAKPELAKLTHAFSRMFLPHLARENTVVFPTLRSIMSRDEYSQFSSRLQEIEARMKPADLKEILQEIDQIEVALGIHDLDKYTAQAIV